MTLIETLSAIGGSSIVTVIVTKIINKKKENADIDNAWKQGRDLDMKFSDYVKQQVDLQVNERTKELRETIAGNELRYYREMKYQGEVFASKYLSLEEQSDRKINILQMKMEVLEKKLNDEITLRTDCLQRLGILTQKINDYENKKNA